MGRQRGNDVERFWSHVQTGQLDECWLWQASMRGHYGSSYYNGKRDSAHRVSYLINRGDIPPDMEVMHTCDNPACVNPAHLQLGTHAQNMHDMSVRGRQVSVYGERAPRGKLKEWQVREIRELLKVGELSQRQIAERYGVSAVAISYINTGYSWKHLP